MEYESVLNKTKRSDASLRGDVIIKFDNYIINLEDYSTFDNASLNKSMFYIMRIFSAQLTRGNLDYENLESVIQINIVDNITPRNLLKNRISNKMLIRGDEQEEILSNSFQIKYRKKE